LAPQLPNLNITEVHPVALEAVEVLAEVVEVLLIAVLLLKLSRQNRNNGYLQDYLAKLHKKKKLKKKIHINGRFILWVVITLTLILEQ
jgi:hypothetical protein